MEEESQTLELEDIPGEILLRVFIWLSPLELFRCMLVCSRWNQLLQENIFWRRYSEKKWDFLHPVDERSTTWKRYFKERSVCMSTDLKS